MGLVKITATVLILGGVLGLVYGGFSYTKETQEAKIGSLELSGNETQMVNIPVWAGVVLIVSGAVLLFSGKRISGYLCLGVHHIFFHGWMDISYLFGIGGKQLDGLTVLPPSK
jgi:hypothetical protein